MKRSEMILSIAEYLIEPKSEDPFKAAEHILNRIEKNGMLPPERHTDTWTSLNDYFINEWEKE